MTWILAQPTFFGQVLALSDIQVTFEDNKGKKIYRDCLQKMYAVENNFIIGFAGNVYGGLTMIGSLSREIEKEKNNRDNLILEPEKLINAWSGIAKKLFNNLVEEASQGGIHLLMAGVSQTQDLGIPGVGKPVVSILKSPEFTPEYAKISDWLNIGSGSEVKEYQEIMNKFSGEKTFPIAKMETQNPGGFASVLGILLITNVQKEAEIKGISKHFHVAIVICFHIYSFRHADFWRTVTT